MGGTGNTVRMEGKKTKNKFRFGNIRARDLIGDVGREGRIILKFVMVNIKLMLSVQR
jgi:hypothetical protein